jgi:predicted Zn finger-like uncharacterized protein
LRIRCERCATVYELDDRRLPARGALVKCTRCQHVFRAAPPGAPSATPAPPAPPASGAAAGVPAGAPATPGGAVAGGPVAAAPVPDEKTALFGFSSPGAEEKTEKIAAAPPAPARPRHPEGGARPRPTGPTGPAASGEAAGGGARVLWIVLALLLLGALVAGVWLTLRKRPDPAAAARRAVLEDLLARDDRPGLERAGEMGTEELAAGPQALGSLALALLAADAADELAPLEARERTLAGEILREESVRAPGWRERRGEIAGRLARARDEAAALRIRRGVLLARSRAALAAAGAVEATDLELLRARVALTAAEGDGREVLRLAGPAAGRDALDPWVEMLRASTAGDVAALEQVVGRARAVVRARVLLARALHAQRRDAEAVALLDEVIAGNPEHDRARAWKAEILAPPPASVSQVAVPSGAPPVTEKGYLPRLKPRG